MAERRGSEAGRPIPANEARPARSTGPVSREGKATVSRNALRHGLTAALHQDPLLIGRARRLATCLGAPASRDMEHTALVAAIAEKTIELSHIRALRQAAFTGAEVRAAAGGPLAHTREALARLGERYGPARLATLKAWLAAGEGEAKGERERAALALGPGLKKLAVLDRYERRALSARARLIRRLDDARARA